MAIQLTLSGFKNSQEMRMWKFGVQFPTKDLTFRVDCGNQLDDRLLRFFSSLGEENHTMIGTAKLLGQAELACNYLSFLRFPVLGHAFTVGSSGPFGVIVCHWRKRGRSSCTGLRT